MILFFLFLLLYSPTKPTYLVALLVIKAVAIIKQSCATQIKCPALGIKIAFVGKHINHLGKEHVM